VWSTASKKRGAWRRSRMVEKKKKTQKKQKTHLLWWFLILGSIIKPDLKSSELICKKSTM
jgi:hypothetical protein